MKIKQLNYLLKLIIIYSYFKRIDLNFSKDLGYKLLKMPKPSKDIETAEGSKKIDINYLFRNEFFKKNCGRSGNLSWLNCFGNNTGNISFESHFTDKEKYIRLIYTNTDYYSSDKTDIDYKVKIIGIPSNLGKGYNYYFVCPFSFKLCKILYKAYGSHYFKSRYAYKYPIYYECQKCSKREYFMSRYFNFKDRYDKFSESNIREFYKGKKTKSYLKLEKLKNYVEYYDYKRWSLLESYFRKRGILD